MDPYDNAAEYLLKANQKHDRLFTLVENVCEALNGIKSEDINETLARVLKPAELKKWNKGYRNIQIEHNELKEKLDLTEAELSASKLKVMEATRLIQNLSNLVSQPADIVV